MTKAILEKKIVAMRPRCPVCLAAQTYHRKKDDKLVCVTCGNEWAGEDFRKQCRKAAR